MSKFIVIVFSCWLVVSCQMDSSKSNLNSGKEQNEYLAFEVDLGIEPPRTSTPPFPPSPEYTLDNGSKIIKSGFMDFEVSNLESAKNKIDSVLKHSKGYYDNEQYKAQWNRISYSLQLRVPNIKFDSLVYVLEKGVGKLKSKNINAKDVTEEYVDLNIRLENNLAYLDQYKGILKKAKSVEEILEVQEKIRTIEEEIESKKGRLKYLDAQVKYSTLSLEVSELIASEITNQPNFARRLINAFNNGVQVFLSFIVGLVSLWPFLILLAILVMGRKPVLNSFKRKVIPSSK